MAKKSKRNESLGNPARLAPHSQEDQNAIQVIIETPKGSRNKYAFDPKQEILQLTKVLPAGMAFPYDFGFVPSTIADSPAKEEGPDATCTRSESVSGFSLRSGYRGLTTSLPLTFSFCQSHSEFFS
jgi:Inorganic pyrophosphatase